MKQKNLLFLFGVAALFYFFEGGCASPPTRTSKISKEKGIYHRVQKGETLYHIAASYNVDVQSLVLANKLPDPSKLSTEQLLYIPGRVGTHPETVPGDSRNQTLGPRGHRTR